MPQRIFITTPITDTSDLPDVPRQIEMMQRALCDRPDPLYERYELAASAADADIVLFVQPYKRKTREYAQVLLQNDLLRKFPDKSFCYDWQDEAPGFLPGVYASMPRQRMDPARYRAGGYLLAYNDRVSRFFEESRTVEPRLLASFRGIPSHAVRGAILEARFPEPEFAITCTDKWYNHDADDKDVYLRELCDSKFVLCPRGFATSSYRMYETMSLGRVPVILSDDWVAPSGVAWGGCSLWVAESRVGELPGILRCHEPEWRTMGERARRVWQDTFRPEIGFYWTLRWIEEIRLFRPAGMDVRTMQSRWNSWSFALEHGWTLPQRAARAVRSGAITEKLRRRPADHP